MTTLSVIVPATNEPPTLERSLSAIRAASDPPEEVIVVREPPFAGPAESRNDGVRQASGDVVVFVDADVLPHDDAFSRIRGLFDSDPSLTAVFGSYDDDPGVRGTVAVFRNLLHHHVHSSSPGEATTFWAGLGAVRRDAFLESGGFDAERFARPSIEDIELGMRMSANGGRIELDPRVQGKHLKAWTLRDMVETDLLRRGVPWVRLLIRTGSASGALNLGWKHRVSALAAVVLALAVLARRRLPAVAALATLVALNRDLYALLLRRQGPAGAAAGVALHVLHHLVSTAAVPVALVEELRDRLVSRL